MEFLDEYRAIFSISDVQEFVEAALSIKVPVKPWGFRLEQVRLILEAAEERLSWCNAESTVPNDGWDFDDEMEDNTGASDPEATELLMRVREQLDRLEVFRKMKGLTYGWEFVRDADEEMLGRILVSNDRNNALSSLGHIPKQVLECIPLHDHAEKWVNFRDALQDSDDAVTWFVERCKDQMALGLFEQAIGWAELGQELCNDASTAVLQSLIWDYTSICIEKWDGKFSIGDPPPLSFEEFCELSEAERCFAILEGSTAESIVEDVANFLSRHFLSDSSNPAGGRGMDLHGLPLDVGSREEGENCIMEVLLRRVMECDRADQVAMFTLTTAVTTASVPTMPMQDRIIRSPLRLMRFILKVIYAVDCPAFQIMHQVDQMYACIPTPDARLAVGASDEEWADLMHRSEILLNHLTVTEHILGEFGVASAISFQEINNNKSVAMSRNIIQSVFRRLGDSKKSAEEWEDAKTKIAWSLTHVFQAMPQRELYDLYIKTLVDQDRYDVLETILDEWQTLDSLLMLVSHAKDLINSSPSLKHQLMSKAKHVLELANSRNQLPEIDEELRFIEACQYLQQLQACAKPIGMNPKNITKQLFEMDAVSMLGNQANKLTDMTTTMFNQAQGMSKREALLSMARGGVDKVRTGLTDTVKAAVGSFATIQTVGDPPFLNPLQLRLKWGASAKVHAQVVEELLQHNPAILYHQNLLMNFLAFLPPAEQTHDISCLLCAAFLLQDRLQDALVLIEQLLAVQHPRAWQFAISYANHPSVEKEQASSLLAEAVRVCGEDVLPEVLKCIPQVEDDEIPADILEGEPEPYLFDPNEEYPHSLRQLIKRDEFLARALVGDTSRRVRRPSTSKGRTKRSSRTPEVSRSYSTSTPAYHHAPEPGLPPSLPTPSFPSTAKKQVETKEEDTGWGEFDDDDFWFEDENNNDAGNLGNSSKPIDDFVDDDIRKPVEQTVSMPSPEFLHETPLGILNVPSQDLESFVTRNLSAWVTSKHKLTGEVMQVLECTTNSEKSLLAREVLCHMAARGDTVDIPSIGDWGATRALRLCLKECPHANVSGAVINPDRFFDSLDHESLSAICRALAGAHLGALSASYVARRGLQRNPHDIALRAWLSSDDIRVLLREARGPEYFTFKQWWRDKPGLAGVIKERDDVLVLRSTYEYIYSIAPQGWTKEEIVDEAPDDRLFQAINKSSPGSMQISLPTSAANKPLKPKNAAVSSQRTPIQDGSKRRGNKAEKPESLLEEARKMAESLAQNVLDGRIEQSCAQAAVLLQVPACQLNLRAAGNVGTLAHVFRSFPSISSTKALKALEPILLSLHSQV